MPCERASISEGLDEIWPICDSPAATSAMPSMLGPPCLILNCRPMSS
jgi:hypothetical protein